jgi:superoxide dismutase
MNSLPHLIITTVPTPEWSNKQALQQRCCCTLDSCAASLLSHAVAAADRFSGAGWLWLCCSKQLQFNTQVGDPQTWASRIIILGYGVLVLIMTHLFTGEENKHNRVTAWFD